MEHHGQLPERLRLAIRQARREQGRSQLDVARDAGLTQKHISNIETGKTIPRYDTLLEIAWALNLDLVIVPKSMRGAVNSLVRARSDPDAPSSPEPSRFANLTDEGEGM